MIQRKYIYKDARLPPFALRHPRISSQPHTKGEEVVCSCFVKRVGEVMNCEPNDACIPVEGNAYDNTLVLSAGYLVVMWNPGIIVAAVKGSVAAL